MTEQECLDKMVAPGTRRPGKYREGVIQIHITRACDKACFHCTQGSNLGGKTSFMSPEHFDAACQSLKGYFGVIGVFGGNPALSPHFEDYCRILREHFPRDQCGLWCNHPKGKGRLMRKTFDPSISNLNVHLDHEAWDEFKRDWPESQPFGLKDDSRHSPVFLAMKDVIEDEGKRWELISNCDINQHWSAMIGVFRGELRAWFCEVAGAQAMLRQDEPDYPDTGLNPTKKWSVEEHREKLFGGRSQISWWELGMHEFRYQVRQHCHNCGVPLRGYGELAQANGGTEQTSETYAALYRPKRKDREVQVVSDLTQLGSKLKRMTAYLENART